MGFILKIGSFIVKNVALLVGIIEAVAKLITGIISMTPTKKDDNWLPKIDAICSNIKKGLYWVSDKMAGKDTDEVA